MIKRICIFFLVVFQMSWSAEEIPRVVIALFDKAKVKDVFYTDCHSFAEMPLNHLGLKVEYHNTADPLPEINDRKDVIGILSWLDESVLLPEPEKYIMWVMSAVDHQKKFVLIGNPGFNIYKEDVPWELTSQFWKKVGLEHDGKFISEYVDLNFHKYDRSVMGFEKELKGAKTPFPAVTAISNDTVSHLSWMKKGGGRENILVSTSSFGGYAERKHSIYKEWIEELQKEFRYWYINPFEFFRLAFDTDKLPKPDTTTLAGSRIYYSHIDGDGWNNITQVLPYRSSKILSSEVILREIFLKYPDLPVTVGPIAADIDTKWAGSKASKKIAEEMFKLDYIEPAVHTYSHPFDWAFFAQFADKPQTTKQLYCEQLIEKDAPLVRNLQKAIGFSSSKEVCGSLDFSASNYDKPRAFDEKPFNLSNEVKGAIDKVNRVCPEGKEVAVYLWSGDCLPFEAAVKAVRELNMKNLNGGDTRYDKLYNSYAWVTPLSRQVGNQLQIYSSNSNENTYTDNWEGRFHGFRDLIETFENTDSPIRVKPMNIYYHAYSGEKLSSLEALKQTLDYIRALNCIPIKASLYVGIVDGFMEAKIIQLDEGGYAIENRGELQTIRFDHASALAVDYEKSVGVIGHHHFQGSLYVSLDAAVARAVIFLKENDDFEEHPYLIESHWKVSHVKINEGGIFATAEGFGKGFMRWSVPENGTYFIFFSGISTPIVAHANHYILEIEMNKKAMKPMDFEIRKKGM